MRRIVILLLLVSSLTLVSCRDEAAHARIAKLESDLQRVQSVNRLLVQQAFSTVPAPIDPTSKAYAFVPNDAGKLLISCQGAKTYLDGHKLTLHIGNPYSMTFAGFTMKVRYGIRPPEGEIDPTESQTRRATWEKTLKAKDVSFTESLTPGSWTKVELILAPSKPEEVGYIDFEIVTNKVLLLDPK